MRIAMIGAGYVGLVSGACFSEFGTDVTIVDRDEARIAGLARGEMPIYEPGLETIVAKNAQAGRLRFSSDLPGSVRGADAVFIAVGTPTDGETGEADLSQVFAAAEQVVDAIDGYTVLVTKSTVPVGTGRRIAALVRERRPEADVDVASNPEFLREGSAIGDFLKPDRVVIGSSSETAIGILKRLHRPLFINEVPFIVTSVEGAEISKYAANAFLATKISFINEVADLCEEAGANVQDVARAIGLDGRIGTKFLHAGPGYGGSCFPKDTRAFATTAAKLGRRQRIVETVIDVNETRKRGLVDRVATALGGDLEGRTIALLGLTFKPNTDDMRDAASLTLVPELIARGAKVRAYDPAGMKNARACLPEIDYCRDAYDAAEGAAAIVILTEWHEFRGLDLRRLANLQPRPAIVDFRNVYKLPEMEEAGLAYHSIGRGAVAPRPVAVSVAAE
jgi:UDPglucose 6-dehydrogenase